MKAEEKQTIKIYLCTFIIVGLGFAYLVEPRQLVIVENAGTIINSFRACADQESYIKQNGKTKKVPLPVQCKHAITVSWCKHPSKKEGCDTETVEAQYGGRAWGMSDQEDQLERYLSIEGNKKNKTAIYSKTCYVHFEKGDKVSVAYLQGKWLPLRRPYTEIRPFKWKKYRR